MAEVRPFPRPRGLTFRQSHSPVNPPATGSFRPYRMVQRGFRPMGTAEIGPGEVDIVQIRTVQARRYPCRIGEGRSARSVVADRPSSPLISWSWPGGGIAWAALWDAAEAGPRTWGGATDRRHNPWPYATHPAKGHVGNAVKICQIFPTPTAGTRVPRLYMAIGGRSVCPYNML